MAISFVRTTGHRTSSGVDSDSVSFSTLPASGNSVFVLISVWDAVGAVANGAVTDNQGNTYTRDMNAGPPVAYVASASIHADIEIGSPSGTFTITVNPPDSSSYFEWVAVEFSGIADSSALDQTAIEAASAVHDGTPTATTPTTTQADELVLGVLAVAGGLSSISAEIDFPAGYTQLGTLVQDMYSTIAFAAGYKIVSSTGTQNYNGGTLSSLVSESWGIGVATYNASSAAPADNVYQAQLGVTLQAVNRGAVI